VQTSFASPADLATTVLTALRARKQPVDGGTTADLVDRVEAQAADLAAAGVGAGEPVELAGAAADVFAAALAVWRAGGVPWTGHGPARWQLSAGEVTALADGDPVVCSDALVVAEPLVGVVGHPLTRLGLVDVPTSERLTVVADWRVDVWLPLVCAAIMSDVDQIALADEFAVDGRGTLAFPGHRAPGKGFDAWVTWGRARPEGGPENHLHVFGDHFSLALNESGTRGTVLGRHRVLNAAGRPIPGNAWGLLGLAGELPLIADTVAEFLAADRGERTWVTDYRARRRTDGTVEFDLAGTDPLRLAGRRISPELLGDALARAGLSEAALLVRDRIHPVLHVVAGIEPSAAVASLTAVLPAWVPPVGVAESASLPRDEHGAIDLAVLAATAPPDDLLLSEVKQKLSQNTDEPVRLRVTATAPELGSVPLPDEFAATGGHYPDTAPAQIVGVPMEAQSDTLADRLVKAAASGRGLVLVDPEGAHREVSYRELMTDASRVAAYLKARGLGVGDEVIVHCAGQADLLGGIWGCILAGVLAVPIIPASPYDAATNPMWHLLGSDTMLTCDLVLASADQAATTTEGLAARGLSAQMLPLEEARESAPLLEGEWTVAEHAFMLLTSGSTGAPKGVPLSHCNLVSLAEAVCNEFSFDRGEEISLNWLAIDHVGGLVQHHIRDLCLANRQVHVATEYVLAKPTRMLDLMSQYEVTLAWQANFGFTMLNEQAVEIADGDWDLSSVKLWENGGEAVTHDSNQRFLTLLAPHGLASNVIKPVFGMTETTSANIAAHNLAAGSHANVHWLAESALDSRVVRALPGAGSAFVEVGAPMAGGSVRVVDATGAVCPEGVIGRIEVTGPQIFCGYYRNSEANGSAFTPDGWLRMGDCGFVVGGSLVVTGREKEVLIVNGLNFAARALETAVEAVPGVRPAHCVAISVRSPGAVTDDIVLFYSDTDELAADPEAMEAALLDEFSLRPVAIVRLAPGEFPRTAIGKVRRPALGQSFVKGEYAEQIVQQRESGMGEPANLPAWQFIPYWRTTPPLRHVNRRVVFLDSTADFSHLTDVVVDTTGRAVTGSAAEDAVAALDRAHRRWTELCAAASKVDAPPTVVLATNEAFTVTGEETGVVNAALPGLAESLAQSFPSVSVKLVDGATDEQLLTETAVSPDATRVAYRDGQRFVAALRPVPLDAIPAMPSRILKPGGSYLVIGGLGGVGALLTQHLLRRFGADVTVVGRSAADADTSYAQTLDYLEGQTGDGARITYRQADATNPDALAEVVRERNGFDAVFALLGEGSIAEQMDLLAAGERDERALRRAADRMLLCDALDSALASRPTPVVTFGSVNGFFGGSGFAHYAAACAYQAARALRGDRGDVCLDWSMWHQVGMAAGAPVELAGLAERRGFARLTPAQGLASLHVALDAPDRRILIGLLPGGSAVAPLLPADLFGYAVQADGVDDTAEVAGLLGVSADRVHCARRSVQTWQALASPYLAALLEVFRSVLGADDVESDDNFFAVGGDSIRAIQVVTRAAERGIRFSALDLFEHKTVGALLAHLADNGLLGTVSGEEVDELVDVSEPVVLTPVFDWWLETADRPELRSHLTMSMRYDIDPGVSAKMVEAALTRLIECHDALRLRLVETEQGPRLVRADDVSLTFEVVETDEIDKLESEMHRAVDPTRGPLVRAALVRSQLVLVIHHAAVDGVSWRIIEDDLALLLESADVELPARTAGFFDWAHRVARRADQIDGAALADVWLGRVGAVAPLFPGAAAKPLEGNAVVLERTVPAPTGRGPDNNINEVLLTAAGWSLARWTGVDSVVVDVEGHGRLERELPVDLSRSVGWFTAIAPLRLDLRGCSAPAEAVSRVRRAVEDNRGRHLEWGLLWHLGACPSEHPLRALPERQVSFNYLGVFGASDGPARQLSAVSGSLRAEQSPDAPRRYLIDIAAQVSGSDLEIAAKFSPEIHSVAEVGKWLDEYVSIVVALLSVQPEPVVLADLEAAELAMALEEVSFGD
jgi:acyl-CoA synthetase (AMP-forming)/AMP-acid ligase II/aryl carrier-like protein